MVKYPTILNLPQADINRQFYEMLVKQEMLLQLKRSLIKLVMILLLTPS